MGLHTRATGGAPLWAALAVITTCVACGDDSGGDGGDDGDGTRGSSDSGGSGSGGDGDGDGDGFGNADRDMALPDPTELMMPTPNPDAFWEDDPPPMMCLQDGSSGPPAEPPGGTPECPDDKNREGCPCDRVGEDADCWPGLRANRDRGICRDGTTTCEPFGEFGGAWGRCEGYLLPVPDAVSGPQACHCFSEGRWEIDNLVPCTVAFEEGMHYAYSSRIGAAGAECAVQMAPAPPVPSADTWSTSRLTVDCAGRFELCYTIKAGDFMNPSDDDCVVAESCVEDWYEEKLVTQEMPPLPSWFTTSPACATEFRNDGGYGEMTVKGLSVECDEIDDGDGAPYVFSRRPYCSFECSTDPPPATEECERCRQSGSGDF